ncbi:MAG TPA: hypothetical protein VHO01_02425 [Jatrophihabitans sp.]|nr:hypothetical protein [Jatrophihabitans sp.]
MSTPIPPARDDARYQAVVARRMQWDMLVWQVPVLAMTAQAFLFTIALGDGNRFGRVVASLLALTVSFLCVTLMARHRQAELTDAKWLDEYEHAHLGDTSVHGETWRARRDATGVGAGRVGALVPLLPGFKTWVIGLSVFGLAAIAALIHAVT